MRLGISAYLIAVSLLLVACEQNTPITWAGYVEEDSIDVSSEVAGKLKQVFVSKGQTVNTGEALFQLDENPEKIQVNEAQARVARLCIGLCICHFHNYTKSVSRSSNSIINRFNACFQFLMGMVHFLEASWMAK